MAKRFCANIRACGVHIVNQDPTRFAPNCNPALLDIMTCSNKSLSIHQLSLDGISDHDLLFMSKIRILIPSLLNISRIMTFMQLIPLLFFSDSSIPWISAWLCSSDFFTQNISKLFHNKKDQKIKAYLVSRKS